MFIPPDPLVVRAGVVRGVPSKVKADSPTKLVPLPPVMTRLSALLDIEALDPAAPVAP